MNLRVLLNIVLILVSAVSLASIYTLVSASSNQNTANQILSKARLALDIAESMQSGEFNYSDTDQLYAQVSEQFPDLMYKTIIVDAGKEQHRANIWQKDILDYFVNHPEKNQYSDKKSDANGSFMFLAKVLREDNEVFGASVVSIYDDQYQQLTHINTQGLLLWFVVIFLVIIVVLNGVFHWLFFKPLHELVEQTHTISKGQAENDQITVNGTGAFSRIAASFNRMQRSLKAAMLMLNK